MWLHSCRCYCTYVADEITWDLCHKTQLTFPFQQSFTIMGSVVSQELSVHTLIPVFLSLQGRNLFPMSEPNPECSSYLPNPDRNLNPILKSTLKPHLHPQTAV